MVSAITDRPLMVSGITDRPLMVSGIKDLSLNIEVWITDHAFNIEGDK